MKRIVLRKYSYEFNAFHVQNISEARIIKPAGYANMVMFTSKLILEPYCR